MKPGFRDFWNRSVAEATAAAAVGLAFVVIAAEIAAVSGLTAADLAVAASPAAGGEEARHVTMADVMIGASGSYAPLPRVLDRGVPEGPWKPEALPYTWPASKDVNPDAAAPAPRVIWLQVPLVGLRPADHGLYLYLPRWQAMGHIAVYADERLVFRSQGDIVWNGFNHPIWVSLNGEGALPPPAVLRLRIDTPPGAGGAVSSLWVGTAAELRPQFELRRLLQTGVTESAGFAFLGLGAFALTVWLLRRRERLYLLFALFTALWVIRGMRFEVGLGPLPIPSAWFGWMTINAGNALVATWYFFVASLVPLAPRWLGRLLLGWVLASAALTLPLVADSLRVNSLVLQASYFVTILAGIPTTLYMTWLAWRHRGREGIIVTAVWLFHAPIAIHDLMLHGNSLSPEGYYWWPISTAARLLVFVYIIVRRYVGAVEDAEQANVKLAERLATREAELAASYEQLRKVQVEETLSRERQRLMQDIHDGMGSQLMSALKVAESGRLNAADMAAVLRECIDDLKLTIDSLQPVEADLLLLLATLRYRLTPRLQAAGVKLRWEVSEVPPLDWLDPRAALHVLRILQEGISNIVQHAGATEIRVATRAETEGGVAGVSVLLCDNGHGFTTDAASETGRGLSNMTRRAHAIGGEATWTRADSGTGFRLWLPLARAGPMPVPEAQTVSS